MTFGLDAVWAVLGEQGVPIPDNGDPAWSGVTFDALGVQAFDRMALVARLEQDHGVRFPADLLSVIDSVDDLAHFLEVKVEQAASDARDHCKNPTGGTYA